MSDSVIYALFYLGGMATFLLMFILYLYVKLKKQSRPFNREEMQDILDTMQFKSPGIQYTLMDRFKDFKAVHNTDSGKKMLAEIIDECEKTTFEREANDHGILAYREGKRYIGRWIIGVLSHTPPIDN